MTPNACSPFLDHALGLLRSMLLAREGDLRENLLVRQGRGSFQLSGAGHEAVAALAPHVGTDDLVFPAYRDRALMHALGMGVDDLARDFFAREGSSSGGRNLPGHFSSRRLNVFSITSPVGAQCLPAVGAAWAFQLEGRASVALCHIGDAATRQGEFFEAVAQAVQDRLPVVFVVEDNGYGISTPTQGRTPLALGMLPETIVMRLDGRDADLVYGAGREAFARTREGLGPTIMWLDLDRLGSHTNADDHRTYRSVTEIDALGANDPLDLLSDRLIHEGLMTAHEWESLRQETASRVREAYVRAERETAPRPENAEHHLYGKACETYPPLPTRDSGRGDTILRATNGTLRALLEADPRVVVFGEDIEDPKGGVFGITKGLSPDFPSRVVNSPLAEATIVGLGVGLAAAGLRPVFELQFVDFVGPAMNQLMAQAGNLRWRTKGEWTCPLVVLAPSGAYLPNGGMWHSGSNEGLLANIPGLRIAVPSTPEDAAGLLWAAVHDEDPSFVLLPKHLLRAPFAPTAPPRGGAVRWGQGRVVREGSDATIVAWGNGVEVALAAADALAAEAGIMVEIIDPRTLVPLDWTLVAESVGRTGRLVVVQEDTRTCGFGQAIVAEMTADPDRFAALRAAPVLVSRSDVPVPFAMEVEAAVLPSAGDVARAVRVTLSRDEALLAPLRSDIERTEDGLTILTIPQLGEGLRQVRVTAFLKSPGDVVALDEPLYEVETDKANVVVESSCAGLLRTWCVDLGAEADVHAPIAVLAAPGSSLLSAPPSRVESRSAFEEFPATDRQRAMTRSALGGRLDIPLPASVGRPLPGRLVEAARARLRGRHPRLRMTEFGVFACAAARATQAHPKFRSSLVERGETVRRYAHVDLGFAIALPEDELATAVVRAADALSFEGFAEEMRARHKEAKTGTSQSDARTTLLISSLAGHDVTDAAPVLFPPAIATLFVGAPHGADGARHATLRLAFDHRLINGVGAADFLHGIERELEGFGLEA